MKYDGTGYKFLSECRVVRKRHQIKIRGSDRPQSNTVAVELKEWLSHIPDHCVITEIDEHGDGFITLEFLEEMEAT